MKSTLFVALLFTSACGADYTNYDVRIGALDPPQCEGYMQLEDDAGYWRCEFIGGSVTVDRTTPDVVFMHLETTPGFFSQVRGAFDNDVYSGQMRLDDEYVSFIATPQK